MVLEYIDVDDGYDGLEMYRKVFIGRFAAKDWSSSEE